MQQHVVNKKDRREGKGRALSLSRRIYQLSTDKNLFYVESESMNEIYYTCKYQPSPSFVLEWCTCPDYTSNRSTRCKHIYAVQYAIENKTVVVIDRFKNTISASINMNMTSEPEPNKQEDEYTF